MRFWRKVHKWLGLLIAIQILLWISGGVVMSVFPIEIVRGQHLLQPQAKLNPPPINAVAQSIALHQWQSLSWQQRGHQWLLKATDFEHNTQWLEPTTGNTAANLTASQISLLASQVHVNKPKIASVNALQSVPFEVRHLNTPMYQIIFDDWFNSTFYIDPQSGQVASVRSDIWRLYDFFWMLHIMDYEQRDDFNNPLLIIAALCALFFTMTGIILLYFSIVKPWYARVKYRNQIASSD